MWKETPLSPSLSLSLSLSLTPLSLSLIFIYIHSHLSSQYLYQTCPEEWPAELVGSNITWAEGTIPCDSSAKMTSCIQDVPGTIGYLESGHGHAENLQEIELQNFNGTYLTSKFAMSNNGIASAVVDFPFTADADFGVVDLLNNVSCENGTDHIAMSFII